MAKAEESASYLPRAQVIGKSVRGLFPAETAEKIEHQDREALAGNRDSDLVVRTVTTPDNGERHVAVRCLRIADRPNESMLINMIEGRTDQRPGAEVAA